MSIADLERQILSARLNAVRDWVDFWKMDPTHVVTGAYDVIFKEHLPRLRRIRWFSVSSAAELKSIWAEFIEPETLQGEARESVFDFYVNGTAYVELMCPEASGHHDHFINHLAASIAWPGLAKEQIISNNVRDHAARYDEFKQLVSNNAWMVFMILLGNTPIPLEI